MSSSKGITDTKTLDSVLKDTFQIHTGFREYQREVIERLLFDNKVLFIARTGHGKSLCYQLPAYLYAGTTLVFSPLRALMKDQNERLNKIYKIPSAIVSSDFLHYENKLTLESAVQGKYKILFIAPERLDNLDWSESVTKMHISMIVIDEAHCISVWGHDFRPYYRRLVSLINKLPSGTPVLGLTATANHRVEQDIKKQMGSNVNVYRGTMERPNLRLQVIPVMHDIEKLAFILEYIQKSSGTGVVYTGTRDNAELVCRFLQSQKISAEFYHGDLETEQRHAVQNRWMQNKTKVVCATNALGMGIDKPDIRFIIHFQIPASPIHYYQEIGRAGRDGKPSDCILLFNQEDKDLPLYFIESAKPSNEKYEYIYKYVSLNHGVALLDIQRETGYSRNLIRQVLADLEEQGLVEFGTKEKLYYPNRLNKKKLQLEDYEIVRQAKFDELDSMLKYGKITECLAGYLTQYLGDPPGYRCNNCANCNASYQLPLPKKETILLAKEFTKSDFPRLPEKQGSHQAGFALSHHGKTEIGIIVSGCKYKGHLPFPETLVDQAVGLLKKHYPLNQIDLVTAVPATLSGNIVEDFARRLAQQLNIIFADLIIKTKIIRPQKEMTNFVQKKENIKDVFQLKNTFAVENKTVLLIDDIYDSGQTLKEIGRLLIKYNAKQVYPFTITKTLHSDRD